MRFLRRHSLVLEPKVKPSIPQLPPTIGIPLTELFESHPELLAQPVQQLNAHPAGGKAPFPNAATLAFLEKKLGRTGSPLRVASDQPNEATKPQDDFVPPFPPLELVTKPNLTTAEIAYYTNQVENTWRIHACRETFPEGLRPLRIGGRLNWPTKGAKRLLGIT